MEVTLSEASEFVLTSYKAILDTDIEKISGIGSDIAFPQFSDFLISDLCREATKKLSEQPMVMEMYSPICVVGDLHGSIHDLLRILKDNGDPFHTQYLFLGDYVDRGQFSVEVIMLLLAFLCQGANIVLLRGNHEVADVCSVYGFKQEIEDTYQRAAPFEDFVNVFGYLPLVAIIDGKQFCVHGGISQKLTSIKEISDISKPLEDAKNQLIHDLLWSDPSEVFTEFAESARGRCFTFGKKAVKLFCEKTGMERIIRAHQFAENGIKMEFNGNVITVFSASSYHFDGSNKCGVLHIMGNELKPKLYDPLPRMCRNSAQFFTMHRQSKFPRCGSITLTGGVSSSASFNNLTRNKSWNRGLGSVATSTSKPKLITPVIGNTNKVTSNKLIGNFHRKTLLIPTFLEKD